MGTTLQNGVYLPNEGERNCYAGLKTNWEILDQKVADVTALQQAVAGALHREIVESLPTTDIDPNTIYMILSGTSATENVYNEFMYVNNAWELIGTSATDLTNYYTKSEVDGKLLLKANASDLTSHTGDTTIHVTTADKNKWNNGVSQAYVVRYASVAVSDNSTVPYANLNNTDNIKANDLLLDTNGKIYQISSVDTANETVSVTTPLNQLAVDANVMHLSGNESASGDKNFQGLLTTIPNTSLWPVVNQTTDDITLLSAYAVHVEQRSSGNLTDLSGGAWNIAELGNVAFFFRNNSGVDIRYKHFPTNLVNRIYVVSNANRQLNNVTPEIDNTYSLGDSTRRWSTINGLEPSALSMPDLANGIDISSYITTGDTDNNYTPSVNGWIWIRLIGNGASIIQGDFGINSNYVTNNLTSEKWVETNLFVTKNVQSIIRCRGITSIVGAKFYPCQGNV